MATTEQVWIEYPELGIKIKASPASLVRANELLIGYDAISRGQWKNMAKNAYNGSSYTSIAKLKALQISAVQHDSSHRIGWYYSGLYNGQYQGCGWIAGINAFTDSIILEGAEIVMDFKFRRGQTFNVLGSGGWKYMRNGLDISDSVGTIDIDALLAENIFETDGEKTISYDNICGLPSGFTKQQGDELIVDVLHRNEPTWTLSGNDARGDYYDVQLGNGATFEALFGVHEGVVYENNISRYYGGVYYHAQTGGTYSRDIQGANYPANWTFDWQTYLNVHPDVFPLTLLSKTVRFNSVNGSYGDEIDSLLKDRNGNPLVINDGDYFEFAFSRNYCYGENDIKDLYGNNSSQYLDYGSVNWNPGTIADNTAYVSDNWSNQGTLVNVRGTFVIGADKVLIAPLGSNPDDPDDPDVPIDTPTETEYVVVSFDAETNGGTCTIVQRRLRRGSQIGVLPTAIKLSHVATGWFTQAIDGNEVHYNTTIDSNMTVYAQFVARVEEVQMRKRMFPYLGSREKHDILLQSRPTELDKALGNAMRVVVRGYFRNPQAAGEDKHLGLYVLESLDCENWQLAGWKEKRLSDAGFHDIGCETYRSTMRYMMVVLTGQLADGSHIDYIEKTGIGRYNNKLK